MRQTPRDAETFADLWRTRQLAQRTVGLPPTATLQPPPLDDAALTALRVAALPHLVRPARDDAPPELAMGITLGEGGMGLVRSARQLALGREVAVKTLRPGERPPEAVRKLLQEALITGSLEHPDIIPVYALGQSDDGAPMIVMKRVEGESWAAVLRDPNHPILQQDPREHLAWHLEVLMRVCHVAAFAHGRRILHRDLKAENVMIGRFGEVYVLDWGIAVSLRDDGTGALPLCRDAREVAGTPAFMAPEMVKGDGRLLDERTDVFLLGGILHEILTGQPLYDGLDVYQVMFQAFLCGPRSYGDDVPAELVAICCKATARDPLDRYPTAEALRRELATFLQHRSSARLLETARAALAAHEGALAEARWLRSSSATGEAMESAVLAVERTFAEGRLALKESLRAWPDNGEAATALRTLLETMIGWHLESGDDRSAARLLGELVDPPRELVERCEAVRAESEARAAQIERLQRDFDSGIGTRTRSFVALVLAVTWTALPLTVRWLGERPTPGDHLAATGLFAAMVVFFTVWARESLFRSKLNRGLVGSGVVAVVATFLARTLAWRFGLPFEAAVSMDLVVCGMAVAMLAATQWPRLTVPAAVYFAAALVGASRPEWVLEVAAVANLTAMSLIAFAWRPAELTGCDLVVAIDTPIPQLLARRRT